MAAGRSSKSVSGGVTGLLRPRLLGATHHPCCLLLAKASRGASPHSRGGKCTPLLGEESCKVTFERAGMQRGVGKEVRFGSRPHW